MKKWDVERETVKSTHKQNTVRQLKWFHTVCFLTGRPPADMFLIPVLTGQIRVWTPGCNGHMSRAWTSRSNSMNIDMTL